MKKEALSVFIVPLITVSLLLSGCLYKTHNTVPSKNLSSILSVLDDDTSCISWSNQSTIDLNDLTVSNSDGIEIDDSIITITKSGNYIFTGNLADGSIVVDTNGIVNVTLNNASITNPSGPAIYIKKSNDVYLTLLSNTLNYLVDGNAYATSTDIGVLSSNGNLTIQGNGSLDITAQYNNGIYSSSNLTINNGSIKINSSNDCISTNGQFKVAGGHLSLTATNIGIDCANKLTIMDGVIEVYTPTLGINSTDLFTINGGTLNVLDAKQGIISNDSILINGGNINASCENTALTVSNSMIVNNGNIHLDSQGNALVANDSITLNNGILLAFGGADMSDGIRCDSETFAINGGTLISTGGTISLPNTDISSQLSVLTGKGLADFPICLEQNNKDILTFMPAKSYNTLLFSSPDLTINQKCDLFKGGQIQMGTNFYGLYTNAQYISGEKILCFTPESLFTNLTLRNATANNLESDLAVTENIPNTSAYTTPSKQVTTDSNSADDLDDATNDSVSTPDTSTAPTPSSRTMPAPEPIPSSNGSNPNGSMAPPDMKFPPANNPAAQQPETIPEKEPMTNPNHNVPPAPNEHYDSKPSTQKMTP